MVDADGRHITSSVPIGSGPLLSAGPELLAALEGVAVLTTPGTKAHELATDAIEAFREREAMVLADWRPEPLPAAQPARLRIVGVAT